jgi:protein-tyrosine phosphatase
VERVAEGLNRRGFVDIHCHLLPGLDDGPADEVEALEMARVLASAGFSEVYCTPHLLRGAYDNPPAKVRQAVTVLQASLDRERIPLKLHPGMEYYLDEYLPAHLEDPLPLGDTPFLLVEASTQANPDILLDSIYQVARRKLTPVLAHPERCETFHREKDLFNKLRTMGCLFQANIGSFAGVYGETVRHQSVQYLKQGTYDRFGTDAHRFKDFERWLKTGMKRIPSEMAESVKGCSHA